MKHPDHIEGFSGSVEDAAHVIVSMRYDRVLEFFKALAKEFRNEAEADKKRGRPR